MINSNKLMKMLSMETAASDWFSKLSKKEQEAYKKAHPRSKYARGGGGGAAPAKPKIRGGILRTQAVDPYSAGELLNKHGIKHTFSHAGEAGGGGSDLNIHWSPDNAKKVHSLMKKHWATHGDGWADSDAHDEIGGWGKLHKHVTGKGGPA